MTHDGSLVRRLLFLLFGPLVWALHLGLAYATHAAVCAAGGRLGLAVGTLPWLLGGVTLTALLALAAAFLRPAVLRRLLRMAPVSRNEETFATSLMRLLTLLSLAAVSYATLVLLTLPSCLELR